MRVVRQLALLLFILTCFACGQQGRKVTHQVDPVYSLVLKDKQIGGLVRVIAVVTPSGTVRQTEPIGGNPVLMIAAQSAVKQWKYEPAASETRELVTLRFDPFSHK